MTQRNYFIAEEVAALELLQTYLHHNVLGVKATTTTFDRLNILDKLGRLTPELERDLKKAAQTINNWLLLNSRALGSVISPVIKKYSVALKTNFYDLDELFNIVFIEAGRILYNYDASRGVQPLTYLLATLKLRVYGILHLDVPYSDDSIFFEQED